MKYWILIATGFLFVLGIDAREHRGPPPACPQPKADCSKPCKQKTKPDSCKQVCDPCCPPVCFERGHETNNCCIPSAYNEPAEIELLCGWDVIVGVNFIYWEAIQGGMDLAIPWEGIVSGSTIIEAQRSVLGNAVLFQGTEYTPGFQVGLGWSGAKDHWTLFAEYTYLHGSAHTSKRAPTPTVSAVNGIAIDPNGIWNPTSLFAGASFGNRWTTEISSKWTYKIDLVDASISRPFYSGTRFTIEPFFGLRGAWIRQKLDLSAPIFSFTFAPSGPTRTAHYSSRSAAVGPRVGMNGNWLFGYGLRFLGDVAGSVLFTGYDVKQNLGSPDLDTLPVKTKFNDLNYLRPNVDLSLGLGWSSYFCCRRMHWDIAALYDFSVFWGQNMMRYLADLTANDIACSGASPPDLYLQGLTLSTRFDY